MAPQVTWIPPDGGWGWVVAGCSLLLHILSTGILLSMGVLYVSWIEEFDEGRSTTSWVISIAIAVAFGMGPLPAALANVYGFRVVSFAGGLLISSGFILSYFATSVAYLVVSIGLIAGLGCCLLYVSAVSVISVYFSERRSLAMGIGTSGAGFGVVAFGPLLDYLIHTYGWRGALLITGAISLHSCAISLLLRPLETVEVWEEDEEKQGVDDALENKHYDKSPLLTPNHQRKENCYDVKDEISLQKVIINGSLIEDFSQPAANSMNNSHRYLVGSHVVNSVHSPDHLRAKSMMKIHNGSLGSVNNGKVFCSLRSLTSNNLKHSNLNIPLQGNRKHKLSVDVILARSIKHLGSISLIGALPKSVIDRADNSNQNNNIQTNNSNGNHQSAVENQECKLENEKSRGRFSSFGYKLKGALWQNIEMLRDPTFLLFGISNLATNLSYATPVMFLVDRAVDSGLDATSGAIIVALNGVGSILGRLIFGALTYGVLKDCLLTYLGILISAGVINSVSPICGSSIVLHGIYAILIGGLLGGYSTLVAVVTVDIMGLEKASASFGLLLTFMGIATLLGPPFGGLLFDWTQSYNLTYIIFGLFLIISALIILPTVCSRRRRKRREEISITIDYEKQEENGIDLQNEKEEEEDEEDDEDEEKDCRAEQCEVKEGNEERFESELDVRDERENYVQK